MNHRMKLGALTLSLLALVACSDTAGLESAFEENLTLDVAMFAADATIDEFGEMGRVFGGGGPQGGTHTATFYDVDGNEQDALDPLTTASIHLVIESTREFSRDTWTGTGTRSRDIMITGLLREETTRTVNGTGSASVTRSQHTDADGTRTCTVVITFNGTDMPSMTVDGEPFEVDMSTRSGRRPFHRRGQ